MEVPKIPITLNAKSKVRDKSTRLILAPANASPGFSPNKRTAVIGLTLAACSAVGLMNRDGIAQDEMKSGSVTPGKRLIGHQPAFAALHASSVSLDSFCHQIDETSKPVDILALNLTIAREISSLHSLDDSKYQRILDKCADHVRGEVQRNLHRFHAAPKDFNNSQNLRGHSRMALS